MAKEKTIKIEEKLMTKEEVAEFLGISVRTLNNYTSMPDNPLPCLKFGKSNSTDGRDRRAVRFVRAEVLRWLDEQARSV